ncbi:hypothetical protein [Butyricicoccus sp.]|uniref:hypothetical protein n=1 Tax=Butyricicoccus sp. TaxID=2049021 RepID=UPI003F180F12
MKQHILGFSVVRRLRQSPVFAFLLAVLLCGMLAGCVTGMHIPQGNETYVSELAQLLASNAVGKMPSVRTIAACVAGAYGWMLAAVILAAIPGRLLWIAMLMAVRGFLLAFAAAAVLTQSGLLGVYICLVSIGISAVLWLPAMLLTSTAVLDVGMNQQRNGYLFSLKRNGSVLVISAILLLGSVLWRLLAVPVLMGLVGA